MFKNAPANEMTYFDLIAAHFKEHIDVVKALASSNSNKILTAASVSASSLRSGGTVFFCGNGGSAADSQHLAAELVGRFKHDRRALRSVALTTDSSVLTCIANDYRYEDIFSRQIEGLARKYDVLIAISTSGNSVNILQALKVAKNMGLTTIALLGKDGGDALALADHSILIPSCSTGRTQEAHILIGHIICDLIEKELGID